jgi:hypothetical protein
MPPVPPSDAELNTMIRARLASVGIDLDQLPLANDPATGTPTLNSVLSSLRGFMRGTVPALAAYRLPAPEGTDPAQADELSQQGPAPALYPSIMTAWTEADE